MRSLGLRPGQGRVTCANRIQDDQARRITCLHGQTACMWCNHGIHIVMHLVFFVKAVEQVGLVNKTISEIRPGKEL
jgi:hypothetical protein